MPVLEEKIYLEFNQEMALHNRVPEHQKHHQKAVFDCFNSNLNIYRPYYELEG